MTTTETTTNTNQEPTQAEQERIPIKQLIVRAIAGSRERAIIIPVPAETEQWLRDVMGHRIGDLEGNVIDISTEGNKHIKFQLIVTGFRINA